MPVWDVIDNYHQYCSYHYNYHHDDDYRECLTDVQQRVVRSPDAVADEGGVDLICYSISCYIIL